MWFIAQKPQEQNLQILEGLTALVSQWIVSFLFSLFLLQSAPGVVHLWAFLVLTRVIWWYSCAHKYNLTLNKCIPRWQVLPAGAYCSALGNHIPKSKSSAWGHCRPVPIWWNHWLIFFGHFCFWLLLPWSPAISDMEPSIWPDRLLSLLFISRLVLRMLRCLDIES